MNFKYLFFSKQKFRTNEEEMESLNQQIKTAKSERQDTDERKQKLELLAQLTQKEQELQKRIDDINKNHPDRYKEYINDGKQLLVLSDLVIFNV